MKRLALLMFVLTALVFAQPMHVHAQEATPAGPSGDIIGFPDPAECTVAARTVAEIEAIIATPVAASPEASPVSGEMPAGEPVDETTEAEVLATLRETVACINTGDTLKILQFYSDELIRRLLAGAPIGQLAQEGTPVPLTQEQQTEIIAVSELVLLPDGRVAVVVTGDDHSNPAPPSNTMFLFVNVGDRWLIDDYETDVSMATPVP